MSKTATRPAPTRGDLDNDPRVAEQREALAAADGKLKDEQWLAAHASADVDALVATAEAARGRLPAIEAGVGRASTRLAAVQQEVGRDLGKRFVEQATPELVRRLRELREHAVATLKAMHELQTAYQAVYGQAAGLPLDYLVRFPIDPRCLDGVRLLCLQLRRDHRVVGLVPYFAEKTPAECVFDRHSA